MIDGGKGQLSAVMEALRELDLADELVVCSLAKQREEVFSLAPVSRWRVRPINSVCSCCAACGMRPTALP